MSDTLAVLSFLALYIGCFVALNTLIVWLVSWLWEKGIFWLTAAPVATVILMANLRS